MTSTTEREDSDSTVTATQGNGEVDETTPLVPKPPQKRVQTTEDIGKVHFAFLVSTLPFFFPVLQKSH